MVVGVRPDDRGARAAVDGALGRKARVAARGSEEFFGESFELEEELELERTACEDAEQVMMKLSPYWVVLKGCQSSFCAGGC